MGVGQAGPSEEYVCHRKLLVACLRARDGTSMQEPLPGPTCLRQKPHRCGLNGADPTFWALAAGRAEGHLKLPRSWVPRALITIPLNAMKMGQIKAKNGFSTLKICGYHVGSHLVLEGVHSLLGRCGLPRSLGLGSSPRVGTKTVP